MLRGSKPGERRGGRKQDTPNRRTTLTDRILSVGLEYPTASRRAFLLKLVRDQKLPADIRMAVAPKCFPAKRSQSSRTLHADSVEMLKGVHVHVPDPDAGIRHLNVETLDAFLSIVQDLAADPKARRKAALKIAEYLLPKAAKKAKALPDEYGFVVTPNLAKLYRDTVREARPLARKSSRKIPAVAEKIKKLEARAEAIRGRLELPCPTKYGVDEAARDQDRLIELIYLRAEPGLTEEQDAEEAHLRVRLEVFRNRPEEVARRRREKLQEAERLLGKSESDGFHAPPHPFQDALPAPAADNRGEIQDDAQRDDADDGGVNFESWLRGEVKYPVYALRAAAQKRFSRTYPMNDFKSALIEDLVLEEKLVPEDQVCAEQARFLPKTAA